MGIAAKPITEDREQNWSYKGGAAVTPSDTDELARYCRALYITGAGNVVVVTVDGSELTFAVIASQVLPVRCKQVKATNTTATGILALW